MPNALCVSYYVIVPMKLPLHGIPKFPLLQKEQPLVPLVRGALRGDRRTTRTSASELSKHESEFIKLFFVER